jgi:phosphocarrier protein FPr
VGGDKPAAWQVGVSEANPALGVRGLRLGLHRPEILDDQLEALVLAAGAARRDLHVMLPMVSTREELDAARGRLEAIASRVASRDHTPLPTAIRLGVMIEVPSAALTAGPLAEVADFFSIGTNDLIQYTLAADRTNAQLAAFASALQPAVLRLIDLVVRAGRAHGRHVAVCGEAAADPAVIPFLVGLGVEELSVAPGSVAVVRRIVASLDPATCRGMAARALEARTLAEVRAID